MTSTAPGKILLEQYLAPQSLSQNRLARAIGVPPRRINEIILGKRAISADTALRLAEYFGNSASYWMHLQAEYDLQQAREKIAGQLARIQPRCSSPPPQPPRPDTPPRQRIKHRIMR